MDILLQGVRRESSLTYKGESKRDALSILLRYAACTRNGLVQYQAMEKTNKGRHSSKASWRSLVSACVSFMQNSLIAIPTSQLHRLRDLDFLRTASHGMLAPLFWLYGPLAALNHGDKCRTAYFGNVHQYADAKGQNFLVLLGRHIASF